MGLTFERAVLEFEMGDADGGGVAFAVGAVVGDVAVLVLSAAVALAAVRAEVGLCPAEAALVGPPKRVCNKACPLNWPAIGCLDCRADAGRAFEGTFPSRPR